MPYKGDGHQFSVRIPKEIWKRVEQYFEAREQAHLSKNAMVLTLLRERLRNIEENNFTEISKKVASQEEETSCK